LQANSDVFRRQMVMSGAGLAKQLLENDTLTSNNQAALAEDAMKAEEQRAAKASRNAALYTARAALYYYKAGKQPVFCID
jgi:hypothetical protein